MKSFNIGLSILGIGIINLYNIIKYGGILYLPSNIFKRSNSEDILGEEGIIKLDINNLIIYLFILFIFYSIFQYNNNIIGKRGKIEYEILLGLGIIGILIIISSNDTILLYLGIELYSFTIYVLILVKETITIRRISIIYLILSSLSSIILLYVFYYMYKISGTIYIKELSKFFELEREEKKNILILSLILISFLFKLGSIPFTYWLIRLYADLDKKILWYQLTIPKLVYLILLIKFINLYSSIDITILSFISYIVYIISIISIIVGAIGGLFHKKDNIIFTYSSILNIGFILLILSLIILHYCNINIPSISEYIYPSFSLLKLEEFGINKDIIDIYISIYEGIQGQNQLWTIYQYILVYILNIIGIYNIIIIYFRSSTINKFINFYSLPYYFISYIILVFSLIGIPPLSGFISKFYLIYILPSYNNLTILTYIIFILFTFISSFYYLKLIFPSSSFFIPNQSISLNFSCNIFNIYILAITTLLTIFYSFFFSFFLPFFFLSF